MICTVISEDSALQALQTAEMAELRLDCLQTPVEELAALVQELEIPIIATYRLASTGQKDLASQQAFLSASEQQPTTQNSALYAEAREAAKALTKMMEAGVKYIDVELGFPKSIFKELRDTAEDEGTIIIRSYHNFSAAEPYDELLKKVEQCFYHDAELAKIVVTAHNQDDIDNLWKLYTEVQEGALLAFSMGADYAFTRTDCLKHGAPYTYASVGTQSSPLGQLPATQMQEDLYKGFTKYSRTDVATIPASKSYAERAILMAALANGQSRLDRYTPCDDSEAAIRIAQQLGATVEKVEINDTYNTAALLITGTSAPTVPSEIAVSESGFLARVTGPLAVALTENPVTITGEGTLSKRQLKGIKENFAALGITSFTDTEGHVPYTVQGPYKPKAKVVLDGSHGSQLISGFMMALPLLGTNTAIDIKNPVSSPYLFLTQEVMEKFGVKVQDAQRGFKIRGNQSYKPANLTIEADWSGAAAFLIAGAVFGKVTVTDLDTDSLQADRKILEILANAGAQVNEGTTSEAARPAITITRAPLNAFEADLNNCPDLFPVVSILAAFCPGESLLRGCSRLTTKESNRLEAICTTLKQLGVSYTHNTEDDALLIQGHSLSYRLANNALLEGGKYTSWGDHRMAFALSLAALGSKAPIEIDNTTCVNKSFPGFSL